MTLNSLDGRASIKHAIDGFQGQDTIEGGLLREHMRDCSMLVDLEMWGISVNITES